MWRLLATVAVALPLLADADPALRIEDRAFTSRFGQPERYPTDVRMPFIVGSSSLVVFFFWRRLRQAEKRATEAMLVKSRVLANLSHELQTPMNGILGLTHLLLETRLDLEQRESIDVIRKSAQDLQGSIRDLLDLSATRQGLAVPTKSRADLLSLCEEVTAMIQPAAREKKLDLGLSFHAGVPRFAHCDAGKVRQILIHLMANAVKFTARGEVRVTVERREGMLQVMVADTGPGVDPAVRPYLFEEFVSGDDSSTREKRGLGLGLALCKKWVTVLGGEIGVRSNDGEGSVFWFAVPVAFEPVIEDRVLAGHRALLIDDGSFAVSALRHALARMGVTPEESPSAALGLRILREATIEGLPYHFVFLNERSDALDRETLKRSLRLDARSARTQVFPVAYSRFDDLRVSLTGQHLPVGEDSHSDLSESLAALMAATSSPSPFTVPESHGVLQR